MHSPHPPSGLRQRFARARQPVQVNVNIRPVGPVPLHTDQLQVAAKVPRVLSSAERQRARHRERRRGTCQPRKRQPIPKARHRRLEIRRIKVRVEPLILHRRIHSVALSEPRETVLTIWDAASPGDEPIHTVENAPAQLSCIAFNHDGTRLVAGCYNGAIIVWNRADGPVWYQLASFPADSIRSISWARDYVAAGSYDGFLSVWDMGTASAPTELLPRTKVGPRVNCLAFAPTTTPGSSPIRIVIGGRGFFEPAHWQLGVVEDGVYRLLGHLMGDNMFSSPTCVRFSPDGRFIASGTNDGKVSIWDADSCKPVCDDIYIPGEPDVLALSFESDDTAVKAVCDDGLVRLLCWK